MSSGTTKRRGRRPGGQDTREALLDAAREVFAEQGYYAATVRSIASRAGVDAAMVNHWFGGKDGLFSAAVQLPINPAEFLPRTLGTSGEDAGAQLVRAFLSAWDSAGGGGLAAVLRSVSSHESATRMLREFVTTVVFSRITEAAGVVDRPHLRASLCGSQLIGLGVLRYVVGVEPLAAADPEALAAAVGPTLQHYLTGDLTGFPEQDG